METGNTAYDKSWMRGPLWWAFRIRIWKLLGVHWTGDGTVLLCVLGIILIILEATSSGDRHQWMEGETVQSSSKRLHARKEAPYGLRHGKPPHVGKLKSHETLLCVSDAFSELR